MRAAPLALAVLLAGGLALAGCVWTPVASTPAAPADTPEPSIPAAQVAEGADRFPFARGGRMGYVNAAGAEVVAPRFEEAGPFSEGLARVRVGGVWGYVDPSGRIAIEPQFLDAADFAHGRARVVFPDAPVNLTSRQAAGMDRVLRGYVNASGAARIAPDFTDARDFAETPAGPLAPVARTRIGRSVPFGIEGLAFLAPTFRTRTAWELLRPDGSVAAELRGVSTVLGFSEGLAAFQAAPGLLQDRGRWGFLDASGEVVIPPRFEAAGSFAEGLAPAAEGGRFGFVDASGAWVVPPRFERAGPFRDGRARVLVDGAWGFVDRTGALAVPADYEAAFDFSEGLALVRQSSRHGFVRPDGSLALPLVYDYARPFRNGLAYVRQGAREGYVTPEGAFVWTRD
jgi:hypothetical protein